MGEFLVEHDDIGKAHPLQRQMTMRVELDANHRLRPDQRAHALDDVAFDIIIAMRHHGAVQPEQHAVDRQRRLSCPVSRRA